MFVGYDHNFAIYGTKGTILTDKTKPLEDAHSFANGLGVPAKAQSVARLENYTYYRATDWVRKENIVI